MKQTQEMSLLRTVHVIVSTWPSPESVSGVVHLANKSGKEEL